MEGIGSFQFFSLSFSLFRAGDHKDGALSRLLPFRCVGSSAGPPPSAAAGQRVGRCLGQLPRAPRAARPSRQGCAGKEERFALPPPPSYMMYIRISPTGEGECGGREAGSVSPLVH